MDFKSRQLLIYAASALSLVAALIHLWVMPEHFGEWWGYGLFFLIAAVAQALFAAILVKAPTETVFRIGIVGNLAIIVLWIVTRTVGVPVFGPDAGQVEEIGQLDLISKLAEVFLVVLLGVLLRTEPKRPLRATPLL